MKILKIALASFLLLAVTSAFVISKSNDVKSPVNVDRDLVWDGSTLGGDFTLGSSGTPLSVLGNYESSFRTGGSFGCSGTTKVCKARITYTYDPDIESDPLPTSNQTEIDQSIQSIINIISSNYVQSGSPSYFPTVGGVYEFTFSISGITITVQVITKS
jgi:hypothetical protein